MPSMKNPIKPRLRGVLFDWDGTLLNSYAADTAAYLAMFAKMQIPWGVAELEQNYSPNWYHVYRAANLPRAQWDAADQVWREHYAKHRPKLLPGARRVLAQLNPPHALGLVTRGDPGPVHRPLREFALLAHLPACV